MKLLNAFALAATLVWLSGCSRPAGSEYFNDGTGQRLYSVKAVAPSTGTIEGTATLRPDGTTNFNGRTYYKAVMTFEGIPGSVPSTVYERLGDDGVYSMSSTDPKEALEFPLPTVTGRKWKFIQDDMNLDMEIAGFEDLETPQQTYRHCLKMVGKGTKGPIPIEETMFLAPNIGLIQVAMKGTSFSLEMKLRENLH